MRISICFFFSSRRRHTRCSRDWSSDVCSSDLEDLVRVAGGLKRSAYTESADLARFEMNGYQKGAGERLELNLEAAMNGDPKTDVPLRDGDILTIRQLPRWTDIGASMAVRGEVL